MTKILLDAIKGKAQRPPVWMMRQAGRYLPEYREVRKKYSFLELCKKPDAAAEVSIQPIQRFDMDGVICFSDILTVLEAVGMNLDFNPGPVFEKPLKTIEDFRKLNFESALDGLQHIMQTLMLLSEHTKGTDKTLLGFSGLPYTLASYAIEGKTSKQFEKTKAWAYREPNEFKAILETLGDIVSKYILAQSEAGADAIQIFDSWAGSLSLEDYRTFVVPTTKKIVQEAKRNNVPIILYINNGFHLLPAMIDIEPDVISVDWRIPIEDYIRQIPMHIGIQGNLEPAFLFAQPNKIESETLKILNAVNKSGKRNFILNLGHGILPGTPIEGAKAFIETAKNFKYSE